MNKILIVIDMQTDFITGALGTPEARAIIPNVIRKLDRLPKDTFVIFTKDTHAENYLETEEGRNLPVVHCVENTAGWEICSELKGFAKGRYEIIKNTFGGKALVSILEKLTSYNEITEIELIGVCTDICVVSNALMLKAFFPEIRFVVDASCCAGVTPEKHNAALSVLESCHVKVLS